jgi:hypothetical protein
MTATRLRWILFAAVAVCPLTALVCFSAPRLPSGPNLTDGELSLAHITKVRLDVEPLNHLLQDTTLTRKRITDAWTETLASVGIEVVDDDPEVPVLKLSTKASVEKQLTGRCFATYLEVIQPVYIKRLDRTLMVTTFIYVMGGIDSEQNLSGTVWTAFNILVNGFIERVNLATKVVGQVKTSGSH